jgi:hypothetical protein
MLGSNRQNKTEVGQHAEHPLLQLGQASPSSCFRRYILSFHAFLRL